MVVLKCGYLQKECQKRMLQASKNNLNKSINMQYLMKQDRQLRKQYSIMLLFFVLFDSVANVRKALLFQNGDTVGVWKNVKVQTILHMMLILQHYTFGL